MNIIDLSLAVEDCVIASAWKQADSQIIDKPDVYKLINTETPYEFMNGVYRSRFGPNTAAKEIEEHFRVFREKKVSFRWYVFPQSKPADLDERLQKFNPTTVTEMQGLYANTDDRHFQMPEGVVVEALSSENIEDYIETSNAGWGQTGPQAEKIRLKVRRDFEKGEMGDYRCFLAKYAGQPAATGLMRVVNKVGYFYGGSTRPEFRGKGAYRGLVCHRLRLLEAENVPLAIVLARKNTSAPICRKLGFQVACECRSYDFSYPGTEMEK